MMLLLIALLAAGGLAWIMSPLLFGDDGAGAPPPAPSAARGDGTAEDAGEALVRRWRTRRVSCPMCGTRPESTAVYCSTCGRDLRGP